MCVCVSHIWAFWPHSLGPVTATCCDYRQTECLQTQNDDHELGRCELNQEHLIASINRLISLAIHSAIIMMIYINSSRSTYSDSRVSSMKSTNHVTDTTYRVLVHLPSWLHFHLARSIQSPCGLWPLRQLYGVFDSFQLEVCQNGRGPNSKPIRRTTHKSLSRTNDFSMSSNIIAYKQLLITARGKYSSIVFRLLPTITYTEYKAHARYSPAVPSMMNYAWLSLYTCHLPVALFTQAVLVSSKYPKVKGQVGILLGYNI